MKQMDAHGLGGARLITFPDRCNNIVVISHALLGNHCARRRLPPFLKRHVIESDRQALQYRVAGNREQFLMKLAIEDAKADRIVGDFFLGRQHRVEFCNVGFTGVSCAKACDLDFDQPAALECFLDVLGGKADKKVEWCQ